MLDIRPIYSDGSKLGTVNSRSHDGTPEGEAIAEVQARGVLAPGTGGLPTRGVDPGRHAGAPSLRGANGAKRNEHPSPS